MVGSRSGEQVDAGSSLSRLPGRYPSKGGLALRGPTLQLTLDDREVAKGRGRDAVMQSAREPLVRLGTRDCIYQKMKPENYQQNSTMS